MQCAVCLALQFGPEDQLHRLVRHQAIQIHRLTGGIPLADIIEGSGLPFQGCADVASCDGPGPSLPAVVAALDSDGIFRKPGRVAAPRLIEHLANAGWTIERIA